MVRPMYASSIHAASASRVFRGGEFLVRSRGFDSLHEPMPITVGEAAAMNGNAWRRRLSTARPQFTSGGDWSK